MSGGQNTPADTTVKSNKGLVTLALSHHWVWTSEKEKHTKGKEKVSLLFSTKLLL